MVRFFAIILVISMPLSGCAKWEVTDQSEDKIRFVLSKKGSSPRMLYVCDEARELYGVTFDGRADTDNSYRLEIDIDGVQDFYVVPPSNKDVVLDVSEKQGFFARMPNAKIVKSRFVSMEGKVLEDWREIDLDGFAEAHNLLPLYCRLDAAK